MEAESLVEAESPVTSRGRRRRSHGCSICSRSFLKPCLLREHMRVHIREGLLPDPADTVTFNLWVCGGGAADLKSDDLVSVSGVLAPHEDRRSEEEESDGGGETATPR